MMVLMVVVLTALSPHADADADTEADSGGGRVGNFVCGGFGGKGRGGNNHGSSTFDDDVNDILRNIMIIIYDNRRVRLAHCFPDRRTTALSASLRSTTRTSSVTQWTTSAPYPGRRWAPMSLAVKYMLLSKGR